MVPTSSGTRTAAETPDSLKEWVARVPRKAVVHRMETAECLEDRVFWAIILWSWCGPQVSDKVVIKDRRGYIQRDGAGNAVPAKFGDLLALLGLAPSRKGNLSDTIKSLVGKGSVRYENRILYPIKEPVAPPKPPSEIVTRTGNVFIAGKAYDLDEILEFVTRTGNDLEAGTEAINCLQSLGTEWREGLKALKTSIEAKRVQAFREHPILIALEEKKRRRETATATAPPASAPDPEAAAAAAPPIPDPDPEPPAPPSVPSEPTLEEVAEVRKALSEYGIATYKTTERLIVRCRAVYRDATAPQIVRKISEVGSRGFGRNVRNAVGVLMDEVPAAFYGYVPEAETVELDPLEAVLSDPEYLLLVEAEALSGIKTDDLCELIESARLPAVFVGKRSGGTYRIRRRDLEAYQNQKGNDDRLLRVDRPDPGTV